MAPSIRKAYVAGKFYPGTRPEIANLIEDLREKEMNKLDFDPENKNIIGGILPHAGHIYSGSHVIHFFEALIKSKNKFDDFIILHPVHRGGDIDFASDENDYWSSPLGKIALDREFIDAMQLPSLEEIHKWEHSAEVMLPFIQYYNLNDKKIVPVGMCWQHPETSKKIAKKLAKACEQTGKKICILASSDFSHFIEPEKGKIMDQKAIDRILNMEPEKLYNTIRRDNISICGYGPIMTLMYFAMGTQENVKVEILSKGHSGEVYPSDSVVDYVSMIFYI